MYLFCLRFILGALDCRVPFRRPDCEHPPGFVPGRIRLRRRPGRHFIDELFKVDIYVRGEMCDASVRPGEYYQLAENPLKGRFPDGGRA